MNKLVLALVGGFIIGASTILIYEHSFTAGDVNHDGRINTTDLSVLLYNMRYHREY